MKKLLSLALALLMSVSLAACGATGPSQQASSAAASSDASASNPMAGFDPAQAEKAAGESGADTSAASLVIPVITGSNAYDVTVSLENTGMPKADRTEVSDGYTFTSASEDYSYTISTDTDYAISSAEFDVLGDDNGFLAFCASIPHDQADGTEMDWVKNNIGTEATTTIGDATYTLSVDMQGRPYLTIMAIGRDDYLAQKLAG